MDISESEQGQLLVFDELIEESIIKIARLKTVKRYSKIDGKVQYDEYNKPILVDFTHERLKLKKNVQDYNKFRKAKKNYIKQLETKYRRSSK